jgi:hypothetical protein
LMLFLRRRAPLEIWPWSGSLWGRAHINGQPERFSHVNY